MSAPEPAPTPRTILVVDDDQVLRTRLARALRDRGLLVREAGDAAAGLALAREDSPELALVDLRMPGLSGLELVGKLREIDPTTQVVVLTGYGSIATAVEAVRMGAIHYLTKPADADEILAAFERTERRPAASVEYVVPSLARVEWEHIQRVLTDCGGNVSQAARLLGIHRRSLQRKLSKMPVQR
jgi:two-component system response regulator RegA